MRASAATRILAGGRRGEDATMPKANTREVRSLIASSFAEDEAVGDG